MINGELVLGIIPARGGSKGVPGKNIRYVGGKPLIAWTIEAAHAAKAIDKVILSSDDDAIIAEAKKFDCEVPFKRDPQLASDETPTLDVVLDALGRLPDYQWVALLQPTSPLRTAQDIDNAVEYCLARGASSCVSVCPVQESPYWMFTLDHDGRLTPLMPSSVLTRRQDLPTAYSLNGAIYLAKVEWLLREKKFISTETVAYQMPIERSLDIDTENDFLLFKKLTGDL